MKFPAFEGTTDADAYLEWEAKVERIYRVHNYSEEKNVQMAVTEFEGYASTWLERTELDRRRLGDRPIETWEDLKRVMRGRFVPSHYHREIIKKLHNLVEGHKSVEEYYNTMEVERILRDQNKSSSASWNRDKTTWISSSSKKRGRGHMQYECPNRRAIWIKENGEYEFDDGVEESDGGGSTDGITSCEEKETINTQLVVRRYNIGGRICSVIVDSESCTNVASVSLVEKLGLRTMKHPRPYKLQWLNDSGELKVNKQVLLCFKIGKYMDEILCDVITMQACHLFLGRPWKYDRNALHEGRSNSYTLELKGKKYLLKPLTPLQVREEKKENECRGKISLVEIEESEEAKKSEGSRNRKNEKKPSDGERKEEYNDVFPEELPEGLPPLRGIEHQIDFVPGSQILNKLAYKQPRG
uniref:Uncharacterized protein LOC104239177 n=1 Tax=Nicotiana sylvestris TaxID=4096 RepID=A0A1U7XJ11_NICSY|nr:PREDICTED: uncharacterized protein LOC104239177 [Nicotiana sylvestris]